MDRRAVVSATRPQPPSGESRGGDGWAAVARSVET